MTVDCETFILCLLSSSLIKRFEVGGETNTWTNGAAGASSFISSKHKMCMPHFNDIWMFIIFANKMIFILKQRCIANTFVRLKVLFAKLKVFYSQLNKIKNCF